VHPVGNKFLYDMRGSSQSINYKEKARMRFSWIQFQDALWIGVGVIGPIVAYITLSSNMSQELKIGLIILPIVCILWAIWEYRFEKKVYIGDMSDYVIDQNNIILFDIEGKELSKYAIQDIIWIFTEPKRGWVTTTFISVIRWDNERKEITWSFIHKELVLDQLKFITTLKELGVKVFDSRLDREQIEKWRKMTKEEILAVDPLKQ